MSSHNHWNHRQTPYEVLGVPPDASSKAIKDAYRKLAYDNHPDRNKSPYATQQMSLINAANAWLETPSHLRSIEYPPESVSWQGPVVPEYTGPLPVPPPAFTFETVGRVLVILFGIFTMFGVGQFTGVYAWMEDVITDSRKPFELTVILPADDAPGVQGAELASGIIMSVTEPVIMDTNPPSNVNMSTVVDTLPPVTAYSATLPATATNGAVLGPISTQSVAPTIQIQPTTIIASLPNCTGAPPIYIQAGQEVMVDFRSSDAILLIWPSVRNADNLDGLSSGTAVDRDVLFVRNGPRCGINPQNNRRVWYWQVTHRESGITGWVVEGVPGDRWLCGMENTRCGN